MSETDEDMRSCDRTEQRNREHGMTLVELLVVLLILSMIAAFAVPQAVKYLGGARSDAAAVQIDRLGSILDLYALEVGRYPTTDEGLQALVEAPQGASERWNGPYLRKADALTDPWGRPYEYRAPGEHGPFDLYSLGADGAEGGEGENADVTSW
ncbi:type II secretion system major pseudopilin GspG [Marimonas arenosa]|uniref:Type II secretion system core protein G n=1 Tax=Marimonas arenosa TaxID=1795305 RepID=A0AAE3WCS8_9RHOB|nr:type II secretion system major pseudopilin GspG [Marimonas arenosa]MDQ2090856.1 type II secretion system major pseudopilin GspG [Marimonas arenosa]